MSLTYNYDSSANRFAYILERQRAVTIKETLLQNKDNRKCTHPNCLALLPLWWCWVACSGRLLPPSQAPIVLLLCSNRRPVEAEAAAAVAVGRADDVRSVASSSGCGGGLPPDTCGLVVRVVRLAVDVGVPCVGVVNCCCCWWCCCFCWWCGGCLLWTSTGRNGSMTMLLLWLLLALWCWCEWVLLLCCAVIGTAENAAPLSPPASAVVVVAVGV